MSETALARNMRKAVQMLGGRMLRLHAGRVELVNGGWMHNNEKGTPDYVVMLPRCVAFFVETKTRSKRSKVKPDQARWHEWARAAGYEVIVPRTVEELYKFCVQKMKAA